MTAPGSHNQRDRNRDQARDSISGNYIMVMVDPVGGRDRYIVAGVEPENLRLFRAGALDLLSLLINRRDDEWFLASPAAGREEPLELELQKTALASFPQLPEPGFLLHDRVSEAEALQEARARNNLVLEVGRVPASV